MPRGGYRENAGKKSRWESGRTFAETKVIRVPTEFAEKLLEMARKLDAGEQIDLVTNSKRVIQEDTEDLQIQINELQQRVNQLESQLSYANLEEKRDRSLALLKRGTSSPEYKGAKRALGNFIKMLIG
jgi:SMC interacting uncharacterized protein involved in chromosome segregation